MFGNAQMDVWRPAKVWSKRDAGAVSSDASPAPSQVAHGVATAERVLMTVTSTVPPGASATAPRLAHRAFTSWLALPFDALRAQYAAAVRAGFIDRSLLASARVERALASLEQWVLGPWARRV